VLKIFASSPAIDAAGELAECPYTNPKRLFYKRIRWAKLTGW
jgi:hypothetical protein